MSRNYAASFPLNDEKEEVWHSTSNMASAD
jgi:hypothetical protein